MFEMAIEFVHEIKKLAEDMKLYGKLFLSLFQEVSLLEQKRAAAVQKFLKNFIQITQKHFESKTNFFQNTSNTLSSVISEQQLDCVLQLKDVIVENEAKLILKGANWELQLKDVRQHFEAISYTDPSVILQKFYLNRFKGLLKSGVLGQTVEVDIFLTLDFFLTIYKQSAVHLEAVISLPVEKMSLEKKERCIEITYTKKGYIWNSAQKISILMQAHDLESLFSQHEHICHIIRVGRGTIKTPIDFLEQRNPGPCDQRQDLPRE